MPNVHLFPATQNPDFDNEHFTELSTKRNYLDYKCFLFLLKILDDIPEHHYPAAMKLLNKRDQACDAALHYAITGVKQS